MLDGPNISVWIAGLAGNVVAAALVAREGGFDSGLAERVWLGQRRPPGHLLPETLAVHVGLPEGARLDYERVIRIAVHPASRGRRIGLSLLQHIAEFAAAAGRDAIGASFGTTVGLLGFWRSAGFEAVRLGISREARSGAHSVAMLLPLTGAAEQLCREARSRFLRQFLLLLPGPFRQLEADLVISLLRRAPSDVIPVLAAADWRDLYSFAEGKRDYTDVIAALSAMVLRALADDGLEADGQRLLVYRVLQHRGWEEIARLTGRAGRKELQRYLRQQTSAYLSSCDDRASIRSADKNQSVTTGRGE